jgi:hypothetical protein
MTGKHFEWEQILDRVEGRLPMDAEFQSHLDGCPACAAARSDAERLRDAMLVAGAPEPGTLLIARTWAAILEDSVSRRVREAASGIRSAARELWATLTADSLVPSAVVRSGDHATPRLLVYETPDYAVSLSFIPTEEKGRTDILGQVVPKNAMELPEGGEVHIANRPELEAYRMSEFGEFRIAGLTCIEGSHLTLAFPEMRIHLGPLPTLRES